MSVNKLKKTTTTTLKQKLVKQMVLAVYFDLVMKPAR